MGYLIGLFIGVAAISLVGRAIVYLLTRGRLEQIAIIEAEQRETDSQRAAREAAARRAPGEGEA